MRNDGYITNLPAGCCVEVPVFVDKQGIHPTVVGKLPSQLAGLQSNQRHRPRALPLKLAVTGDPELVVAACALDPLSSAVATLKEVRDMVGEMLEAEAQWAAPVRGQVTETGAAHRDASRH